MKKNYFIKKPFSIKKIRRRKIKTRRFKPFKKNISQYLRLIDQKLVARHFFKIVPSIISTLKKRGKPLWKLNQKKWEVIYNRNNIFFNKQRNERNQKKLYKPRRRRWFPRFKKVDWNKKKHFSLRWKKLKKPFWRKKSYNFVKLYNLIVQNTFKALRKPAFKLNVHRYEDKHLLLKDQKYKKRILPWYQNQWLDYYRKNKAKFWFRNKIALRLVWMNRYACWTQRKAFHFVWRARRRTPALLRFWKKYEFTLDRYIIWWQLANQFTKHNIYYSRWLIRNGYVYVNYLPVIRSNYQIQSGDCILFLKHQKPQNLYFVNNLINPFKSKFRRGFRFKFIIRRLYKTKYIKRFQLFLKKYKLLKLLNSRYISYFIQFYYFIERSYKYYIFVNLQTITWFVLLFSSLGKFVERVNYHLLNSFVNRRYG